jgi:hypothetical protein
MFWSHPHYILPKCVAKRTQVAYMFSRTYKPLELASKRSLDRGRVFAPRLFQRETGEIKVTWGGHINRDVSMLDG